MLDRFFIDTNIFVYAYLDNPSVKSDHRKHILARRFLSDFIMDDEIIISTQVCNEYYSALLKNGIDDTAIQQSLTHLTESLFVASVSKKTVFQALSIKNKYRFSLWDSLIVSSALENDCSTLFSEDMQHGQIIEGTLTIRNPLLLHL